MLDFINSVPDSLLFVIYALSIFFVCISFVWWFESSNDRKQLEDFEKQPERWNEFLRTGDDYHFMKKGEDK
jgi:hypothetical protein